MSKEELKSWLEERKFGAVIIVCPRCGKVDINPNNHLDKCDPGYESYRQENEDNAWK